MAAEATCISKPLTIIPMAGVDVQDAIAAGQVRAGEQLIEAQQVTRRGTIAVHLAPLYTNGPVGLPPDSSASQTFTPAITIGWRPKRLALARGWYLHMIDAIALVHALVLRMKALARPIKTLVLGAH